MTRDAEQLGSGVLGAPEAGEPVSSPERKQKKGIEKKGKGGGGVRKRRERERERERERRKKKKKKKKKKKNRSSQK